MQPAARRQPTNRHSLGFMSGFVPAMDSANDSFIRTLRLTATGLSLVHSRSARSLFMHAVAIYVAVAEE